MLSFIICIFFILWNLYLTFIYNETLYVTFLLFQVVFLILSAVQVWILVRKITCDFWMDTLVANANDKVDSVLKVQNDGKIPLVHAKAVLECKNSFNGEKKRIAKNLSVGAGKKEKIGFVVESTGCGVVNIQVKKLVLTDVTGLIRVHKKVEKNCDVTFLPQQLEMDMDVDFQLWNTYGESDIYDKHRPGDDPSEIFDIRDFRPGDRLQKVHWRATAKAGKFMVKENARPLACGLVVLLDLNSVREDYFINGDRFVTLILSYSAMLLRKECYHYIAWYDRVENHMVRYGIWEEEDLFAFTNALLRTKPYNRQMDLKILYEDMFGGENSIKKYRFTLDGKMWEGGNLLWDGDMLWDSFYSE